MPVASTVVTTYKLYGAENEQLFDTGGGQLFLLPPPAVWQGATNADRKAFLASMFWKDESCTEIHDYLRPWCILVNDGLKVSMKQGNVEFTPNDRAKIQKKNGTYDEATLTGTAYDIVCSPKHYVDLMGDKALVDYYDKPATATDRMEAGTSRTSIGPTKLSRPVIIIYKSLGHPEVDGRCTVRYFYGDFSADFEGEFSISNPLKAEVRFDLRQFPNIKQPNGMPVYQILEAPELAVLNLD